MKITTEKQETAVTTISKAEKRFNEAKKEIEALANNVSEIEIVDDSSLAIGTKISIDLNQTLTRVEKLRKELKEPSIVEGKAIDALAKTLSSSGTIAIASAKSKILAYNKKAQDEKLAELALLQADVEEQEDQFCDVEPETIKKIEVAQAALISSAPTNVRKIWDYELVDIKQVPMAWLTINEKAMSDYIKENKGTMIEGHFNGVRFFQKESVVLR